MSMAAHNASEDQRTGFCRREPAARLGSKGPSRGSLRRPCWEWAQPPGEVRKSIPCPFENEFCVITEEFCRDAEDRKAFRPIRFFSGPALLGQNRPSASSRRAKFGSDFRSKRDAHAMPSRTRWVNQGRSGLVKRAFCRPAVALLSAGRFDEFFGFPRGFFRPIFCRPPSSRFGRYDPAGRSAARWAKRWT